MHSRSHWLPTCTLAASLLAATGCGTMNAARPLAPGEHMVGATVDLHDAKGGGRYAEADRSLWALNQTDLLASWQRERWLGYTGVSQLTDFRYAGLHLAPILGGQVGLGEQQRWSLQVESRYYGVNKRSESTAVPWVTFGPGAMGLTLGVQKRLGGDR